MSDHFLRDTLKFLISDLNKLSPEDSDLLDEYPMSSSSFMGMMALSSQRQILAPKMGGYLRSRLQAISPFWKVAEKIEVGEDGCALVPRKESGSFRWISPESGRRVLTKNDLDYLSIPIFEISHVMMVSISDIREQNLSAFQTALSETLYSLQGQEQARYSTLTHSCPEGVAHTYAATYTELTIISCDRPDLRQCGFSFFESIGMAVELKKT